MNQIPDVKAKITERTPLNGAGFEKPQGKGFDRTVEASRGEPMMNRVLKGAGTFFGYLFLIIPIKNLLTRMGERNMETTHRDVVYDDTHGDSRFTISDEEDEEASQLEKEEE